MKRYVDSIILHCSDSPYKNYDFNRIRIDHINRGWKDIGYHIGIDFEGKTHILRPIDEVGAHTKGYNKTSIGICLLGRSFFEKEQFEALADIVSMLMKIFNITPDNIKPHNELNPNKTCPNFDVEQWKITYLENKLAFKPYGNS